MKLINYNFAIYLLKGSIYLVEKSETFRYQRGRIFEGRIIKGFKWWSHQLNQWLTTTGTSTAAGTQNMDKKYHVKKGEGKKDSCK